MGVGRELQGTRKGKAYIIALYHSMTQLLAIFDTKNEKNAIKMKFFIRFSTFSIAF